MKDHNTISYFSEGHPAKDPWFSGEDYLQSRCVVFYILLFFAVSIISRNCLSQGIKTIPTFRISEGNSANCLIWLIYSLELSLMFCLDRNLTLKVY